MEKLRELRRWRLGYRKKNPVWIPPCKCYDLGPGKWTKDLKWNFQKPFSRESLYFTATRFSLQNGYAHAFCSDPHGLLIHGNFTVNFWFTFRGPGHSICRAQVNTTLGFPSGSKNWPFKRFSTTMLRAMGQQKRSKRAQLQFQLIRFETKAVPFFLLKVFT